MISVTSLGCYLNIGSVNPHLLAQTYTGSYTVRKFKETALDDMFLKMRGVAELCFQAVSQ